jgi:hypothetical protein
LNSRNQDSVELVLPPVRPETFPAGERLRVSQRRFAEVMERVEAAPPLSSGALLVGRREKPAGMILVERNRVCWAAAAGMRARMRDILRSHLRRPLSDGELEALYQTCREADRPLGEVLVARDLVAPEHMRAAMKQHTVESLLSLDRVWGGRSEGWPLTWVDRSERTYNPSYTFTAAEVLGALGARLVDPLTAELITLHLEELQVAGCAVAAFAGERPDLVIGAQTGLRLAVHDLADLASWASAALDASPGFSPAMAHAWAQSADGGAVAWRFERQVCAAICLDRASLARLVIALDNRSLALVLATRLSVLDRVRERMALANG